MRLLTAGLLVFLTAGCATKGQLETFLNEILNPIWQGEITDACVSALTGSAGFFTYEAGVAGQVAKPDNSNSEGHWHRARSLAERVETWDEAKRGPGAAMTVLDNRDCIRDLHPEADRLLWGDAPGIYYVSDTREVIVVLYDGAERLGMILVQAR